MLSYNGWIRIFSVGSSIFGASIKHSFWTPCSKNRIARHVWWSLWSLLRNFLNYTELYNTEIAMDLINVLRPRLELERQHGLSPECQVCTLFVSNNILQLNIIIDVIRMNWQYKNNIHISLSTSIWKYVPQMIYTIYWNCFIEVVSYYMGLQNFILYNV